MSQRPIKRQASSFVPSNIPWMPSIPSGWSSDKVKYLFTERIQKGYPDEPLLAATQTKGVVRKEMYENRTVTAQKDLHPLKLVEVGDFVISLRSFQGGIEFAHCWGIISPAYTVLKPKPGVDPRYFAYALKCKPFVDALSLYVTGIREGQNIDYTKFSRSELPVPPLDEQQKIVSFIEEQDRRIRKFTRNKKKLMELLEERKLGIIREMLRGDCLKSLQSSSKGTDEEKSLPSSWTVCPLGYRYRVQLGKMLDAKRITGEYLVPYLRNTDVQWDEIRISDLPLMDIPPSEYQRYTLQKGDLMVCEGGDVGRCAFWNGDISLCGYQKALHRIRPLKPEQENPRFLFYLMLLASKLGVFRAGGEEATIAHLTAEKLKKYRFPFPPRIEQDQIVRSLENTCAELNKAINGMETEIVLASEFRSRLIADAVTGKVDLRNFQAAEPGFDTATDESDEFDQEITGDEELLAEAVNAN